MRVAVDKVISPIVPPSAATGNLPADYPVTSIDVVMLSSEVTETQPKPFLRLRVLCLNGE